MSDDLLAQLAEYGGDHRARQAPVTLAEVLALVPAPVEGERASRPARVGPAGRRAPRRRAALVALAAVVVALAVAVALLADVGGDAQSVDVDPAASTPTASTPDRDIAPTAFDGPQIELVAHDAPTPAGLANAAVFRGAIYAVTDGTAGGSDAGALYRTTDGATWERLEAFDQDLPARRAPALFASDAFLASVERAADRGSFYALGSDRTFHRSLGPCEDLGGGIRIDTSTDGEHWGTSRVEYADVLRWSGLDADAECAHVVLARAAAGPGGVLLAFAVAVDGGAGDAGRSPASAHVVVWSADARQWSAPTAPFAPPLEREVQHIAATDDGFLVTVSDPHAETGDRELWRTRDGSTWEALGPLPGPFDVAERDGEIFLHNPDTWFYGGELPFGLGTLDGEAILPRSEIADRWVSFDGPVILGWNDGMHAQSIGGSTVLLSHDGRTWTRAQVRLAGEPPADAALGGDAGSFRLLATTDELLVVNEYASGRLWVARLP